MKIEDVLARNEQDLLSTPGVVGVGVGERAGRPVILVMLDRPATELHQSLPSDLDGYPVEIEGVGEITAY
jgi:hypothetical protein